MHIHILGICGTFMGGIAALAKAAGHEVSGCDAGIYPPMSAQLKKLGIDEDKLNLTYAKAVRLNQAHMVVTYYAQSNADPLILDNLDQTIKPASERSDLLPVFSFNGIGLWLAKERGRGKLVGESSRYKHWQDLQGRMPEGLK